jgi:SurA-like protein/parvulin-like peptidyl-prolyl cis-trans isomerase-like protein
MMKLLRRHKDWLMIVIAILAIPFIFYFVRTPDYGAMKQGDVAQIYGRNLSQLEIDANARLGGLAQGLGMSDFWETLSLRQPGNGGYGTFAVDLIILRHEAERLGLRPSPVEVADVVRKLPVFQGESGFDITKFTDFVRTALGPLGLGEEHIEQLARDQICLNEIKELLAAGVTISKVELDETFRRGYDKFFVSVIRFRSADLEKDITVKDEDVQKYYDAHKAELKTDEKRKVEFVRLALTEDPAESINLPGPLSQSAYSSPFTNRFVQNLIRATPFSFGSGMTAQLPDERGKLTGPERIEALQKLADRATDFTQALLEKDADFRQAAAKFQLPVNETGEFTAAAPDPMLKENPQLSAAAFKLSAQEPNSDPVQVADGFYILHLLGVTEAHPLTMEEAKPKIVDAIKKSRTRELMSTKAAQVVNELRDATKSTPGSDLQAAIQKAGVKTEKVQPFSLFEEETANSQDTEANQSKEPKSEKLAQGKESKNEPPSQSKGPKDEPRDLPMIKQAVAFLNAGDISDFVPSAEDGFIAILEKREPFADADAGEKKAAFEKRLLDNKQRIVLYEWLHDRQQAAGLGSRKS